MFKTLLADRETIENKYHLQSEPFDHFNRMYYHGYDYDPTTGMDDDELKQKLAEYAKTIEHLSHPVIKAKLFEFVLDNTRIDVNEHDYFIGLYSWGRVISPHTVHKWAGELNDKLKSDTTLMQDYNKAGVCYGWLDYDHTVPDWDSLCELGFSGVLERARNSYNKHRENGTVTEKMEEFFKGVEIEYQAIIRFIDRLYKYSLTKSFEKAPIISECLKNLRDGAPKTTLDVLQLIYIYFMLSESVDHYQVRSLGYGLDSTLLPYFENDVKTGKFTKDEIAEFIGYFLMQWSAINNYWGQPVYLGGRTATQKTLVNELSYMVLDVYDKLGLYNPKIQIKTNADTPKDFVLKALDMIRHGNTSIVFCSDSAITKSLMARGATYEEACDSVLSGCYEYKVKAKGIGISCIYFSALKPVCMVIDSGFDTVTGKQISIKTKDASEIESFEEFYSLYLLHLKHLYLSYLAAIRPHEEQIQTINPSLMFSATIPDCVNSLTDAIDNGIENFSGGLISGLGSAIDSLMGVKELVFDKKLLTLPELKKALDNNWEGYEKYRLIVANSRLKYGNGNEAADLFAPAIVKYFDCCASSLKNGHGYNYSSPELHSARAFVIHGEATKATPDGRFAGQETSKNASPAPGADKSGITALVNSVTAIETTLCASGSCLDAMLHPSAVQGEDGLEALYAVLTTYQKQGGHSIHFNIFSPELLRDAQEHPENYKNLQVRVCGWNILWNNMDKKEQDAYIQRAESISY
ncbi:MAG: hypothetical protein E7656_09890 [Ruminococcaceae bacterium]|nr:hypothetical protein [Oscillospiraceae bacterium]